MAKITGFFKETIKEYNELAKKYDEYDFTNNWFY